jgi:competence protein ComFB
MPNNNVRRQTMLKNYMEVIIENTLPDILNDYTNLCKCEICINDIKALALNGLKPLYMVTEKGNMFLKLNELQIQFKTDVTSEIIKSIETISKNPRHT